MADLHIAYLFWKLSYSFFRGAFEQKKMSKKNHPGGRGGEVGKKIMDFSHF